MVSIRMHRWAASLLYLAEQLAKRLRNNGRLDVVLRHRELESQGLVSLASGYEPMKAMILAAGLGTRLRRLTDNRLKALKGVSGRDYAGNFSRSLARSFGIRDVMINVHHFADMILDYLKAKQNFAHAYRSLS